MPEWLKSVMQLLREWHPLLPAIASFTLLSIFAYLCYWVAKTVLIRIASAMADRTTVTWDDDLLEHNVISRLVQVLPAIILLQGLKLVTGLPESLQSVLANVIFSYIVFALTLAISATLSAANAIYSRQPVSNQRPLKGFVQLLKLGLWMLAGILIVAIMIDREPWLLLSGFGAMTAVILLVFKDTILSLVASIQLTAQDMIRIGDWIEMPQFNADGKVIDMQLHTVKVQNFDKTISTIPTYSLIDNAFINWRGMKEAGARRIKRSLHIDISTIAFQSPDQVDRFKRFALLDEYIDEMRDTLREANADLDEAVNSRRLTNIGLFRAYTINYLKSLDTINQEMTLMVRQLEPEPDGLALEIYCFTTTTEWANYERIQADIFDHLLSIIREFDLSIFQRPSGASLNRAFDVED